MAGKEYEIEFKIKADQESSFAKTIKSASGDFKELADKVKQLNKGTGKADTTKAVRADLMQTRTAFLNTEKMADRFGNTLKRVAVGFGGIFAARKAFDLGKDFVNTYADFEQGLANVKSVSGATAAELALLGAEAKKLGASTAWSAKEVTDAETLLAQAGFGVEQTIAALPGLLSMASADQIDLAQATDIAAGTLKAFSLEAAETTRVADVLALAAGATNSDIAGIGEAMKYVAPVSQSLRIDLEQTAAAIGALSDANIKGSQAGTVLRTGLTRLAKPAKAAQKVMSRLGFNAFDAGGKMLPLHEIIEKLEKSTAKLNDKQKASDIATIFGMESMSGFLALMEQGPERLKGLTEELRNSKGAAQEMADTRLDSFHGSITLLKSAMEGAKLAIGEKLAPTIKNLVDNFTTALPHAIDKFEASWKTMTNNPSWENADWLGKMQIMWDKIISEPFKAWWSSQGKAEFEKVAGEIGKTIKRVAGGVIKEAFTGSGATQLLSLGAIAIPGVKMGKGIAGTVKTLTSLGKAGGTAGAGVADAAGSASRFAPALAMLTNPIGLTIAGVGILTAGVIAYKKHQENARQSLINMGGTLQEAQDKYEAVADKSELTSQLADEYRTLDEKVRNNVGTAEELADAQQRMVDITAALQDLFPQTLTNYDLEKGKILEKLGLMEQMSEAEREAEKMRLEATVAQGRSKQGKLEKEIGNLTGDVDKAQGFVDSVYAQKNAIDDAIPKFREYENEYRKLLELEPGEERTKAFEDLLNRANELGSTVGKQFGHLDLIDEVTKSLNDNLGEAGKELQKALDKRDLKLKELQTAKDSYQELYDAQVQIIELDLGSTLEQAAENYKNMTDTEKTRFDAALISIDQINSQIKSLTDEPFTIHVQTVFDEAHQLTGVPYSVRESSNAPVFNPSSSSSYNPYGLKENAIGGFATTPEIFGEAGLEAAIPINNKPRSHALLDQVNKAMGHDRGGVISVTFAPVITIPGGTPDAAAQVSKTIHDEQSRFETMMSNYLLQQRRLGF